MEKPRPLYKPQEDSVDINVNVYENESCHNICNDTVGCSAGNVVAGCDCGGINFVPGCICRSADSMRTVSCCGYKSVISNRNV